MSDTATPTMTPDQIRYRNTLSAMNLASELGRAGLLERLTRQSQRQSDRLGESASGLSGIDFGSSDFNVAEAQGLRGIVSRNTGARGGEQRPMMRAGTFNKRIDQLLAGNIADENRKLTEEKAVPVWDRALDTVNEMAGKPAFGADYISRARAGIASKIKEAESARLRRVSAALGLRGLDPSSPAGAQVAANTALEADRQLAESLTGFDMDVEQFNRSDRERMALLASDLATKRVQADLALKSGDQDRIFGLSDDISSIIEAIRQQQEMREYMDAQARDAENHADKWGYINLVAGGIKGAASMGIGGGGGSGMTLNPFNAANVASPSPSQMVHRPISVY